MSGPRAAGRERLEGHNRSQKAYYGSGVRKRMVPADTRYLQRQIGELLQFAGVRPDDDTLEVGCGMGRYTLPLAARGFSIEGLDLSPYLLDRLREFDGGRSGVPLHCADLIDFPAGLAGRFDAVIGFFMLHHVHDLKLCFAAMSRMLKPSGRIAFLEPNPLHPGYYAQVTLSPGMTWKGDGGILRMRPARVMGAMQAAGFTDMRMRRFGFFPPLLANAGWGARLEALLERMPAGKPFQAFQLFTASAGSQNASPDEASAP
ncbi:MAG: class I SAM-dependent methyltransferase [Thermoleophilia bacterium]